MNKIEEIKKDRIEKIKEFIMENGLENLPAQEVANIYNLISHYDYNGNFKKD